MKDPRTKWSNLKGQGHEDAENTHHSVVVEVGLEDAFKLSDLFLLEFAMESCLYYDGMFLSMCFGEAGSGAESLRNRIVQFSIGYFYGKYNEILKIHSNIASDSVFLHRNK